MSDSLSNSEMRKLTVKKQLTYEFDKKQDAQKLEQAKKDAITSKELQRQKIMRNSFIVGFAFVLLLALIILKSYRQKRKATIEIIKQKRIIEEK